ncbi:MAG: hypothetical protein GX591_18765 [Planctomycetes bacterium]|nr:hypothetical protein [Planctomycetota bacterium]
MTLIWPDGTLHNTWLQVTVKASKATGLGADDVFFFANVPGDANSDGAVDLDDFMLLKHHFGTGGLDIGQGDFDLDDDVDLDDFVTLKNNFGTTLKPVPEAPGLAGTVDLLAAAPSPALPRRPHRRVGRRCRFSSLKPQAPSLQPTAPAGLRGYRRS